MQLAAYVVALASAAFSTEGAHLPGNLEECEVDNWGVAGGAAGDEPPMDRTAREKVQCDFTYKDLDQEPNSYVNWYDTTQAYKDYRAIDMTPSRHWEYLGDYEPIEGVNAAMKVVNIQADGNRQEEGRKHIRNRSRLWVPGKNGPPDQKKKIQIGECAVPQSDGGAWHVQRVGPFVSNGGYDWWQVAWRDMFRLSEVFKTHPEGIYYTTTFSAGVAPSGEPLSYPPVHIHHIHVIPQPGTRKKMPLNHGYVSNMVMEMHGDYVCLPQDGGVDCYFEVPAKDNMQEIRQVLDVEGDLNDVRASGSPPMEWWYQVVVRWHPKAAKPKAHPLSQIFYLANGHLNQSDQSKELQTFDISTSKPVVYWYSGTMFSDGELVRNKVHAHNLMFREAFWFHATPEELGLTRPPKDTGVGDGFPLEDMGFNDFLEFKEYLKVNLEKSRRKYESTCKSFLGKTSSIERHGFHEDSMSTDQCKYQKPFTVCRSFGKASRDIYDPVAQHSYIYDRRSISCCEPWTFKSGEVFTTVGLYWPADRPAGPWESDMPATYPQHLSWFLTYKGPEAEWGRSFYTWSLNKPYKAPTSYSASQLGTQTLYGDALYHSNRAAWMKYINRGWPDGLYNIEMDEIDESSMMQTSVDRQGSRPHWIVWHLLRKPHQNYGLLMPFAAITGVSLAALLGMKRSLQRLGICKGRGPVQASVICSPPCCPCIKPSFAQKPE
jgi:hypothetical protein